MLGHREPAEDVTQETFLKALRAYGTIRPHSNIYAWLCRIAKNATIDYVRCYEQARCTSLDTLTWDLADQETTDPQTRYTGTYEHIATALASCQRTSASYSTYGAQAIPRSNSLGILQEPPVPSVAGSPMCEPVSHRNWRWWYSA